MLLISQIPRAKQETDRQPQQAAMSVTRRPWGQVRARNANATSKSDSDAESVSNMPVTTLERPVSIFVARVAKLLTHSHIPAISQLLVAALRLLKIDKTQTLMLGGYTNNNLDGRMSQKMLAPS